MPRRRLTAEERALWRRVVETAVPMRPKDAPSETTDADPTSPALPPSSRKPAGAPAQSVRTLGAVARAAPARVTFDLAPDPGDTTGGTRSVMDRRRFEKLRRGRLEPEARLDLHGMTSQRAHAALTAFILAAHGSGVRLVLVITGKGRAGEAEALAPHRHGVLRHSVPHWLAAPPLAGMVLQVAPAHQRHGGGGAYYVYLRRRR